MKREEDIPSHHMFDSWHFLRSLKLTGSIIDKSKIYRLVSKLIKSEDKAEYGINRH